MAIPSRPRVLYVEDDPVVGKIVAAVLSRHGLELRVAIHGEEGVEYALAWLPNLIVMDLMMPVMDGFEATEAIRANPQIRNIPIVAFSANSAKGVVARVRSSGMNAFVPKSGPYIDLVKVIREHVRA